MQSFREWITRDIAAPSTALPVLLSVLGIMLGLLAMHSFTASAHHDSATERTIAVSSGVDEASAVAPKTLEHGDAVARCPANCDGRDLSAMGCVLAFLSLLLLVALPALRARVLGHVSRTYSVHVSREPLPRHPSLHVLSISRT